MTNELDCLPEPENEMNTISNQTCTKCQNCGEWTNYADDGQHRARMERLDEARETITRLNRRLQMAESGLAEKLKDSVPGSLGRALANAAAEKYMHERDEALAEVESLRERIAKAPIAEGLFVTTLFTGEEMAEFRGPSELGGKRVALVELRDGE